MRGGVFEERIGIERKNGNERVNCFTSGKSLDSRNWWVSYVYIHKFSRCFPANRLDFKMLYQLPYEQLAKEKSRFEIFQACYPENYSIACMAVQLSRPKFQVPITFDSTPTNAQREDYEQRGKATRKTQER